MILVNYLYNHSTSSSGLSEDIYLDHDENTTTSVMTTTQFRLNVAYIPSFSTYTLHEQAYFMHHADIIYSPDGAQLSNLLFIRPCTVSVEFFPRAYYLQFFQPLTVGAHGISFEGYPSATINYNTNKITDSLWTAQNYSERKAARNSRIMVSSNFFARTLPQLIKATLQCRANYDVRKFHNELKI